VVAAHISRNGKRIHTEEDFAVITMQELKQAVGSHVENGRELNTAGKLKMKVKLSITDSDIAMIITGLVRNRTEYEKIDKDLSGSKKYPNVARINKIQIKQANYLIEYLNDELQDQNRKRQNNG
jgi:hypothetical protein